MIQPGRFTAHHKQDFVVFLIGMRVNKWWQVRQWLPVAQAMPKMLRYLHEHPESGFLGSTGPLLSPNFREITMIQYWESSEKLEHFARHEPELHPEAWKQFFLRAFKGAAAGIWHETYKVKAGNYECIYGNMPNFGLAKATQSMAVTGKLETMRGRLNDLKEPSPTEANKERIQAI
ncbi:MAG: DUF4188 domain-containing protein [Trueperaceae bacterium]|nr:DUF4188 domain-containing protein [Trueperaceae bacterium]